MLTNSHPLKGWIPYKLIIEDKTPLVQWIYVSDTIFNHPFFEETIAACKSHTYNSSRYRCVSSLENMIEWSYSLQEIPPITFIFHVSRCGSTLLSQLIALNEKYTVLPEVPFFDELLRLPYKLNLNNDKYRNNYLRAAIKFIGQNKNGNEQRLFIKTDSWHIFFHRTFRQLFPTAPFILLFRSPDEVIYSHQKVYGMQAIPGLIEPEIFGFKQKEITELSLDAYMTKVLEKYMHQFEEIANEDELSLLINYGSGVMNMIDQVAIHLNINWTEDHRSQMYTRSKFHSKNPQLGFRKELQKEKLPEYLETVMKIYDRLNEK